MSSVRSAERRVDRAVESGVYGVATATLRSGMILFALAAATDWLFAALGGHPTPAALAEGLLLTAFALVAVVRGELAAVVLTPPGRVTILAGLFAAAGALDFGLQSHYGQVASAIMFIAALVCSRRWVAITLAVSMLGYLADLAIQGRSVAWMLGAGQSTVVTQLVDLLVNALVGMFVVGLVRRFLSRVPETLHAARTSRIAITSRLADAVAGDTTRQLSRADPAAIIGPLTSRERNVLTLLARGRAPKQAARDLCVELSTVRSHIAAAKRKTGARTLEQLVALFVEGDVAS